LRLSSFVSYFFAGAFLKNGVPHFVVATTGRRNITPFGRNSSPLVNLLWGLINFAAGYLLMRFADSRAEKKADSTAWQLPYEAGTLFWSLFGVIYAWFATRQEFKKGA